MAHPMVKDGATDQVRRAGGESLFITLALASGGQRVDVCVYAFTRLLANVALSLDDIDQARDLLNQVAQDAISELELNWPDRKRLIAESLATTHREPGHG